MGGGGVGRGVLVGRGGGVFISGVGCLLVGWGVY